MTSATTTTAAPEGAAAGRFEIGRHAVLVRLQVRMWSASVTDRRVSQEITERANADRKAGRFIKQLVDQSALRQMRSIGRDARLMLHARSMPWDHYGDGVRLVPIALQPQVRQNLEKAADALARARSDFLAGYEAVRNSARERLGALYVASEFPDADQVRRAIYLEWSFLPVPQKTHFAFDTAVGDEVERLGREVEREVEQRFAAATDALFGRLSEALGKAVERLAPEPGAKKDKVFRDTLLTNIRDAISEVRALNLAGDERIETAARRLDAILAGVEPNDLRTGPGRDDERARAKRSVLAEDMQSVMEGYLG